MAPTQQGSIKLFRLWGIAVSLHWSWFIVAFYSISTRLPNYAAPMWAAFEYFALFAIVLTHEFGHALACRQVGGRADHIVLWPLGGVAYVAPPSRPGATLWSIAAGPLVNVLLLPIFFGFLIWSQRSGWRQEMPDVYSFIRAVTAINVSLLVFNLLPVYPLDGGQILRSLLWFPFGRARSLMIATVIGFIGGVALVGLAMWQQSLWIGLISLFLLSNCWRSFQHARRLRDLEKLPRRPEFECPTCQSSPPIGQYWRCEGCRQLFDLFASAGVCPNCNTAQTVAGCADCGSAHAFSSWQKQPRVVV